MQTRGGAYLQTVLDRTLWSKRRVKRAHGAYLISPYPHTRVQTGGRGSLKLVTVINGQRRVIGEALVLIYALLLRLLGNARGGDLVVDAPADVFFVRPSAVGPPGVLIGLVVERAEHVHPAEFIEHLCEPGALLRQEAGILLVRFPVFQIDFLVRDVPVAAKNIFTPIAAQLLQHGEEVFHEAKLGFLAVRARRTRRQVKGNDTELPEVSPQIAPFVIVFLGTKTDAQPVRLAAAVERHPGITLLFGAVEKTVKTLGREHLVGQIGLLRLDLLQAHDIRVPARQPLEQAFPGRGTDAVDVERDDAHGFLSYPTFHAVTRRLESPP